MYTWNVGPLVKRQSPHRHAATWHFTTSIILHKAIIVLLHQRLFNAILPWKRKKMLLCRLIHNPPIVLLLESSLIVIPIKCNSKKLLMPYWECMCSKLAHWLLKLMSDTIYIHCIFIFGCEPCAHNWEFPWVHIGFLIVTVTALLLWLWIIYL